MQELISKVKAEIDRAVLDEIYEQACSESGMPEWLEHSCRIAREIFGRCYPEFEVKVFFTGTWLISPDLEPFLKPGANLRTFSSYFSRFTILSHGMSVYSFLFNRIATSPSEVDHASLPEDTSLQRSVKAHLSAGGTIHEWGGYFLF